VSPVRLDFEPTGLDSRTVITVPAGTTTGARDVGVGANGLAIEFAASAPGFGAVVVAEVEVEV